MAVDILVVGAGPVGLTMACELARHGVRCRIVDRLAQPLPYCRAIGVTPRTLEVWEDMGVAREMIDAGLWIDGWRSIVHGRPPIDAHVTYPDLPYGQLGVPQYETERLLARHLGRFGVAVEREVSLTALSQDGKSVTVRLIGPDGRQEEAAFRYVVGCDGAHSAVRHALGIAFEGEAYPMTFMLGDVHIGWDLPRGMALRALRLVDNGAPGMFIAIPLPEPGRYRCRRWRRRRWPPPEAPIMASSPRRPGPVSTTSKRLPTISYQRGRASRSCAGRRLSGSACGLPNTTDEAASSSLAMPPISTRRLAAKE